MKYRPWDWPDEKNRSLEVAGADLEKKKSKGGLEEVASDGAVEAER